MSSQGYGFSSSHVWMWEVDCEEGWALKNWCFWAMVLEKTLECSLDYKETQTFHPKENQSWMFTGRTDAEAEALLLWPPDGKSRLTGKDWCLERLKAGEGDDRGWDGWMASLTQQTWVWASSGREWGTGKPGVLQSMGSQRVGLDWATEQQQDLEVKITSWSIGYRMNVVLASRKTTFISLYISIRALAWPGTLSISSNILKGILFSFWAVGLSNGFKIFSNRIINRRAVI